MKAIASSDSYKITFRGQSVCFNKLCYYGQNWNYFSLFHKGHFKTCRRFCYFVSVGKTHLNFLAILIFNLNLMKLIQIKEVTIINFLSY